MTDEFLNPLQPVLIFSSICCARTSAEGAEVLHCHGDDLSEEPDDDASQGLPAGLHVEEALVGYLGLQLHGPLQQRKHHRKLVRTRSWLGERGGRIPLRHVPVPRRRGRRRRRGCRRGRDSARGERGRGGGRARRGASPLSGC